MDLRCFVRDLEQWLIDTLAVFGVAGMRREGRVGIWVEAGGSEAKIAAIGVRVRRWVTFHGVSLNVAPDLSHYRGIVACGIREHGVTSLAALGVDATMDEVDCALQTQLRGGVRRLSPNPPAPRACKTLYRTHDPTGVRDSVWSARDLSGPRDPGPWCDAGCAASASGSRHETGE